MGKLIDADKLKRKCQKTATEAWKMKIKAPIETTLNQFIDWIDQAEPADALPSAQQTALTADDIETIRIHLSAFKEKLCNQGRWAEAAEYERLIQRLTGKGGQDGIAEEAEKEV